MGMAGYSLLLAFGLGLSAPWWLWRIAASGRYREGLGGRLGRVPRELREAVIEAARKRHVVWVHAVSVGEVLAVERLVLELGEALPGWVIAVSTTTATGQAVAKKRLAGVPVFFFPLDFAFTVRRYLRVLRPSLVVLVESELWPRLLAECERARVPVAVVNARVSDRSFRRTMPVRGLWRWMAAKVAVFLAQGEESAGRLRELGVAKERVVVSGNLKYDLPPVREGVIAQRIGELRRASRVIVAGSTHEGEERLLLEAWPRVLRGAPDIILVIAPRHPERFQSVAELLSASGSRWMRATDLLSPGATLPGGTLLLLDTIGDLGSVYEVGSAAFIGGSLVPKGGHNPLEAARFGVPTIMGPSYDNFREIVEAMKAASGAPTILQQVNPKVNIPMVELLSTTLITAPRDSQRFGRRSQEFYEGQAGATKRTVVALMSLLKGRN